MNGLYQVSNFGNVKSYVIDSNGKILKLQIDKDGYSVVHLYKNKKMKRCKVHRLVAQAFLKNPNNYEVVNHKDENKRNNFINNLEWCSIAYNNNYNNRQLKIAKKREKKVLQINTNYKVVNIFNSIRQAETLTGVKNQSISKVCKGKRKTAGGYIWKYKEVC